MIDQTGIRADPDKTAAIQQMKPPTTIPELRRFMGMVNQLGKFTPNLAQLTQPLRELLSKNTTWVWGPSQSEAFSLVKAEMSKPTTLALYDPKVPTKVSADASSYSLGAVLMQETESRWRPVAYASRSMTDTELRYAQIEKEALAITWSCEKFSDYILGKTITIETDHKPLVPLLGTKHLDGLPPRGSPVPTPHGSLYLHHSSCPREKPPHCRYPLTSTLALHGRREGSRGASRATDGNIHRSTPSQQRATRGVQIRSAQQSDQTFSTLMQYCRSGWPDKRSVDPVIRPYWEARGELTMGEGLLLCGGRIVVPEAMQAETLQKLQQGHQGVQRCRLRAIIRMVARHVPQNQGFRQSVSRVLQRRFTKQGATAIHPTPRLSVAEGQHRPVRAQGSYLPLCSRLLLQISGGYPSEVNHVTKRHQRPESNICPIWHPRDTHQ